MESARTRHGRPANIVYLYALATNAHNKQNSKYIYNNKVRRRPTREFMIIFIYIHKNILFL